MLQNSESPFGLLFSYNKVSSLIASAVWEGSGRTILGIQKGMHAVVLVVKSKVVVCGPIIEEYV